MEDVLKGVLETDGTMRVIVGAATGSPTAPRDVADVGKGEWFAHG